jgi:pimeloyl-ACP methyl ester carboxylesterase
MPSGPIDLDEVVNDSVALMKHLGHDRFHVVGYSLGAVAALKTAAMHPDRVLTATSLCGWSQSDARMRVTFDLWRRLIAVSPDLFMRYAVADGYTVDTISMLEPMIDSVAAMASAAVQPGSDAHLELDIRVDIEDDLGKITCPTLVIGGRDDRWVDISKSRHIASKVGRAELVELPAGHLCIGELAGDIATLIAKHTS